MVKVIHFKTALFDVTKEKENPFNTIHGISLLQWLREELKGRLDISEPDAEDWGWYSELEYDGNSYMIGACAYFEEGDDLAAGLEWAFQVHKHRSLKDKLLGGNKMTDTDSCFVFFRELFEKHKAFSDLEVG